MAGLILLAIGYLRLGTYIKYIPHPVLVGFTAGIAVIIFSGEIRDLFGLTLAHEPSALIPPAERALGRARHFQRCAVGVSALCLAIMLSSEEIAPRFPGMLAAVALGAVRRLAVRPAHRDHRHALWRHSAARCRRRHSRIRRHAHTRGVSRGHRLRAARRAWRACSRPSSRMA